MTLTWPRHLLTLEEWDALPEAEDARLELVEGVVVLSPRPMPRHQLASAHVTSHLNGQLPRDLVAVPDVEVLVLEGPPTVRAPDVVVTRTVAFDAGLARFTATDVLLAVEVLSDGTRRVDRVLKFSEYAEAGIPQYWIVDLGAPATLLAYALVGEHYELSGEHTGAAALDVAGHPVSLDLGALTTR